MSAGGSSDRGLFSPTIVGFLVAGVVAVFALSVLLATKSREETPFRATIDSASAIGHKGFQTLLERLDWPLAKSRINAPVSPGRNGVLLVVEPDPALISFTGGSSLATAPNILLVLPKWTGAPDLFHDGWVSKVELLDRDIPRQVLAAIGVSATVLRGSAPVTWTRNRIGAAPGFEGPVQLLENSTLRPLIGDGDKILLGEFTSLRQRIWILSDPDPIENHGLITPANTTFVLALLRQMRRGNGRVVFDETTHGVAAPDRNPIQLLFTFPFVIVTVQILAVLGLLLWATTTRFGGAEEPPPAFASGKALLIDNIASLMDRAGHQAIILRRYIAVKLAETGRAFHAPVGLDDGALAVWLDRVGASRGIVVKAAAVLDDSVTAVGGRSKILPRLFSDARDMYRWHKDMLDGSGDVRTTADAVRREIGKAIVGQDAAVELLLTSLLAGGHILIEGVPGTGKTMLAQAFAATLSLQFGRVQFTPDMMPGDVLGTSLFNFQTGEFTLTPGPIFTQVLLADEINRTPPKTQAALLQAMNERAVTIDTRTHALGDDFMVVATQNPIEQHGTYPLPEAQLDRFLFKITIGYPTRDEERAIVVRHGHQSSMPAIADFGIEAVADAEALAGLRALTQTIRLESSIVDYIVDVMRATRAHPAIETGASTRAANMLAAAVRAYAALNGRDFVIPDDVKRLAVPLVRHRVVMAPHAEIDGLSSDRVLGEILDQTAAPR